MAKPCVRAREIRDSMKKRIKMIDAVVAKLGYASATDYFAARTHCSFIEMARELKISHYGVPSIYYTLIEMKLKEMENASRISNKTVAAV